MASILVPFTSREWQIVQNLFQKHGQELIPAAQILTMWRARQGSDTPVIFQITDHLIHVDRLYYETNFHDDYAVKTLVNNYSTVIVRVINYINEICQSQKSVSTIASAVATMDIPEWIVNLRHRAAHNHMPPFEMFKKASDHLREWVWERYWSKSIEEGMKWAIPKKAFEEEMNKTLILKQKQRAHELVSEYVQWKNTKPNAIIKKSQFKNFPAIVEIDVFIKECPGAMNAFLSSDVLTLAEEKMEKIGFGSEYIEEIWEILLISAEGIWEIPPELQAYWSPLIAVINNNGQLMNLVLACIKCMYETSTTLFYRKQLAGWVDLFLDMLLMALKKDVQSKSDQLSRWRQIIKCILTHVEDFRPCRAIEVFEVTKIFSEKKTKQLVRLINLRSRDLKISKTDGSGDTLDRSLDASTKNLSFIGKNLKTSVPAINDPNADEEESGKEWGLADEDFSDCPMGLMPTQNSESLFLSQSNMSTMYSMQPFDEVHVEPAEILYKLPSYHGEEVGASSSQSKATTSTNDKSAELKELVQKVVDATNKLAITMKEFANGQKKQTTASQISSGPYFHAPSTKKLAFELHEGFSRASAQFHYKVAQYEPITNKKFEVYAGPKYHHIIKLLQEINGNRKTSMTFRDVTTDGIYVETTGSDEQKVTVKSPVPALLLIGQALGIYSYQDFHLAGTSDYLARIDDALHGRIFINDLVRESSQHLGPMDLLTKSNAVSLADIVFYAAIHTIEHLPNNVELHVKRVHEALSSA